LLTFGHHQYLDPTLKKIEWSREEDEQLLHLSKVFGGQWATVATQMPGRTQYMLQERYNKLLDEEHEREVKAGVGDDILPAEAVAPTGEDVRRLRPGEVDYFAESRPARPDAVDMDEVDLEMLQEARARMVNVSVSGSAQRKISGKFDMAHYNTGKKSQT
jgi:pre-mRNA-splicing factor CDC5/CEF1